MLGKQHLLRVSACVTTRDRISRRALDGALLEAGDQLLFWVGVTEPAYVRLVQVQRDQLRQLWPESAPEVLWRPRRALRIPEERAYNLDGRAGEFSVFVIASRAPLGSESPALLKAVSAASAAPRSDSAHGPEVSPAQAAPVRERGLEYASDDNIARFAMADADGLAVIQFRLTDRYGGK